MRASSISNWYPIERATQLAGTAYPYCVSTDNRLTVSVSHTEIANYRAGDRDSPATVLIGASRVLEAVALLFFTFVE